MVALAGAAAPLDHGAITVELDNRARDAIKRLTSEG
jgi:hypothetical protein